VVCTCSLGTFKLHTALTTLPVWSLVYKQVLKRVVSAVWKRLGQVKSAVLIDKCVIHVIIIFIINTNVWDMFLALKDVGAFLVAELALC
jgi:hypothetical protein